jgi:multidrug transporter EmrE-like cation transporter
MADSHTHKTTSWVSVLLIIVSSTILGIAFVAESMPLAVAGGVVGVAGAVMAVMFGLMDDAH